MSDIYYWTLDDTAPELIGTIEREIATDVFVPEDLTGKTVAVTLYRANDTVYKADAAVAITDATGGRVKYTGVVADTRQGRLTGKFRVTYAPGITKGFPNTGPFQIRVSR
jgi:hypothetical protein